MVKFDNIQFNFHLKYFPKNESKNSNTYPATVFFFSFSLKESNSKKEMSTYPILSWSLKQGHITLKSAHHQCDDLLFLVRLLRHVLRVRVLRTKFVNTITFEEMHLGTPNLHEVYILGKSWISFFSTVGTIDLLLRSRGSQTCPKMACWHNNF